MKIQEAIKVISAEITKFKSSEAETFAKKRVVELMGTGSDATLVQKGENTFAVLIFSPGSTHDTHSSVIHNVVNLTS